MTNAAPSKAKTEAAKPKHVTSCNFRSASRISNEDARALTSLHEGVARNLTTALDAFLGAALEVRFEGFEQMRFEQHVAGIPELLCIVPFSAHSLQRSILLEFDIEIVLLMVDLLLGGAGEPASGVRDLSEIEDEILMDVFELIMRQAEEGWRMSGGELILGSRVKPAMLDQYGQPGDKVTCLNFKLEIGPTTGSFRMLLPAALLGRLLQQVKGDQPQKRSTIRQFPRQDIRQRILDSDVEVSVELPNLKVAVKDLVALLPGSVIKLRAPVRNPGMLAAGGRGIFEATPVRNGSRKAAQLGRRVAWAFPESA